MSGVDEIVFGLVFAGFVWMLAHAWLSQTRGGARRSALGQMCASIGLASLVLLMFTMTLGYRPWSPLRMCSDDQLTYAAEGGSRCLARTENGLFVRHPPPGGASLELARYDPYSLKDRSETFWVLLAVAVLGGAGAAYDARTRRTQTSSV